MNARTRMLLVGIVIPALIALAGSATVLVVAPFVPNPIATHWGPTGAADAYGPLWTIAILPVVVVGGYCVLAAIVVRSAAKRVTGVQKLLLVTAPFLAAMITVVSAGSVLIQRGLADASDAPSVVPVVLTALVSGAVLALAGWFVLPQASPLEPEHQEELLDLGLAATARATWVRSVRANRSLVAVAIVLLTLAVAVGAVALWVAAPLPVVIGYVLTMLLLSVLVAGNVSWRVSVDRRGFRAVSIVGWPRFTYSLAEVKSASVVQVNPIGDFGGWGLRWAGRWGVIMHAGEALQVTRTNDRSFVVTVPDAQTGARLLNTLVHRVE